jgi:Reverse transcriptase (RNA-dependent DNA polymerase)
VRGDLRREGIDYFDTYAPIVSWTTVPLLLVLSVVLGLYMVQVDYTLAFVQVDIDDEIYIEMPRKFEIDRHVLRLNKSVYGLEQTPLNFFFVFEGGIGESRFQAEFDGTMFVPQWTSDLSLLC